MKLNQIIWWCSGVYGVVIALLLVIPGLVVIPLSFSSGMFLQFPPPGYSLHWFYDFFADAEWRAALIRSLLVAACSASISVPLGIVAAIGFVHSRNRAARVLESIMMIPMMTPIVIFGFALYVLTLRLDIDGGLELVTLAHAVLSLPFVIVIVGAALRTFDFRLVRAARVFGATTFRAYWKIVLPVISPSIFAATLISLMVSLDEPVISTFIAGDTPTIPSKMFSSIIYSLNPLVPVAATVLMVLTIVSIIAVIALFLAVKNISKILGNLSIGLQPEERHI